MTARPKVLLLGEIKHAHDAWRSISDVADIVTPQAKNRNDFITEARSGVFDGVVAAYRTFKSLDTTGFIDGELLDNMPTSLRFICHNGAGYDHVNVAACTAHNILLSNTPTAVDDATADITLWLLLGALRNLPLSMATLRSGQWRGSPPLALGHDPQDKVLGILGMGGIGRCLANKARAAFGMRIRYHNRSRLPPELEAGAEYVDFDTLLAQSDVLSLNLPLNTTTHHTISTPQFALMKQGIIIINTARGAVIHEAALVDALASGRVASVGLDVYEDEPNIHPDLLANDRVLLLPHMGTWSVETQIKMEECALSNVHMAITQKKLRTIVPEQKHLTPEHSLGAFT